MQCRWYEQIPVEDLTENQLRFGATNQTPDHLRMIGSPSCLQDVLQVMNNKTFIWKERGFFTLAECDFLDESCCSSLRVGRVGGVRFALYGPSDEEVAQIASFLWSLEDREEGSDFIVINYGIQNLFDFRVVTAQQLALLFQNNPGRKTHLHCMAISATQSSVLATQPHKIDLRLADCFFEDGDQLFLNLLENRSTSFGSLRLPEDNPFEPGSQCRLFQMPTLGFLSICPTALERSDMLLLPFASKVDKLKYCVDDMEERWRQITSITIVPKKCVLKVQCDCYEFPSVFLRATGHLTELGLVYAGVEPSRQELADLAAAVERNQSLEVLEIGYLDQDWLPGWQNLMSVVGRHRSLRRLKIKIWADFAEPRHFVTFMNHLLSMLKRNHNIDVDVVSPSKENAMIWKLCIDGTLSFNRFVRGSKALPRCDEWGRSALLGCALMQCLGRDARRTNMLLADNIDELCMLMRDGASTKKVGNL